MSRDDAVAFVLASILDLIELHKLDGPKEALDYMNGWCMHQLCHEVIADIRQQWRSGSSIALIT